MYSVRVSAVLVRSGPEAALNLHAGLSSRLLVHTITLKLLAMSYGPQDVSSKLDERHHHRM